jgi:hypothetical protein
MASVISVSTQARADISRRLVWGLLVAGTAANTFGIAGGSWDGAYHRRYVVDTFFSPPHLMIYGGMLGTLLIGLAILGMLVLDGWSQGDVAGTLLRRPLLLLPLLANLGFLATGPFDDVWHRMFGRDKLTPWTVPHAILLLNLAATAVGVAGLALWLRAAAPAGGLPAPQERGERRRAEVALFIGLSMALSHVWPFVSEWEGGFSLGSPVLQYGWIYPPTATLIAALTMTMTARLFPGRWWLLPLVALVSQIWRLLPSFLLTFFGYPGPNGLNIVLLTAATTYGLIEYFGQRLPARARYTLFGAGYIGVILLVRLAGRLPTLTSFEILATALLLPAFGILGGELGARLAGGLRRLAGDRV